MEEAWTTVADAVGPGRLVRVLGASLWMLWVGWPSLVEGAMGPLVTGLSVAFAFALLLATRDPRGARTALGTPPGALRGKIELATLLGAAPALLATSVAARDEALNAQAFAGDALGMVALVLAALAFVAFGAAVLHRDRSRSSQPEGQVTPLGEVHRVSHRGNLWDPTRAKVVTFVAGAVGIAIVAPHLGSYEGLVERWTGGAPEGAVLTSVAGGALGTAIAGVFLANSLRQGPRGDRSTPGERRRLALRYLLVAMVAAAICWSLDQA